MTLIVSTCLHKLSEKEFVRPIAQVIEDCKIVHYQDDFNPKSHDRVIITGTALQDNAYLNHIDAFSWLKTYSKPVLGVCAGMQILALVHGATLLHKKEIGMITVRTQKDNPLFQGDFAAYALHGNAVEELDGFDILATSDSCVQAIRKHNYMGILFHPEVRNTHILDNFSTY